MKNKRLRYLSLFSGIEAATVAFKPLGWELVAVSEIEPFACDTLSRHYPDIKNLGDITKITREDIEALGQDVCSLSEILETGPVANRYFLPQKACAGILRRSEVRGKKLPPLLRLALEAGLESRRRNTGSKKFN